MERIQVEAIVQQNGRIVIDDLPFDEGEKVEVIVREADSSDHKRRENPLKGTLIKYDDPFEPAVPPEDWEALQ